MPTTIKDADGNDVEMFSAAEAAEQAEAKAKEIAEAQVQQERERLNTEHEAAILDRDEKLADAQEKLEKAQAKELNFKALREKTGKDKPEADEKTTKEIAELRETVAAIQKQPFEQAKTAFLQNNIGSDKDLGEKFELFFKKLSAGAKTVEEYTVALDSSLLLASGGIRQPNRDGGMVRTSVNPNFSGDGQKVETQDSQNFGTLLGINAEDKKALSGKNGTMDLLAPTPLKKND